MSFALQKQMEGKTVFLVTSGHCQRLEGEKVNKYKETSTPCGHQEATEDLGTNEHEFTLTEGRASQYPSGLNTLQGYIHPVLNTPQGISVH